MISPAESVCRIESRARRADSYRRNPPFALHDACTDVFWALRALGESRTRYIGAWDVFVREDAARNRKDNGLHIAILRAAPSTFARRDIPTGRPRSKLKRAG